MAGDVAHVNIRHMANKDTGTTAEHLDTVAAVDLGSNSFHMVITRASGATLTVVDRRKESVRLAAGLGEHDDLAPAARERALACLARFGQRLRSLAVARVRAVGTDTLRRIAAPETFLAAAEQALGHPIEIIAGVEEARLIYVGVSLDLGPRQPRRLVVDIGGGSTELAIGHLAEPCLLQSLALGAIGYSERFFAQGRVTPAAWRTAVTEACRQLAPIAGEYRAAGWDIALGASGSIRAIQRVCRANGWADERITRSALDRLATRLIKAQHIHTLELAGLSASRRPIFAGAVAILTAVFDSLGIDEMAVSDNALREGLTIELLGRIDNRDLRQTSVAATQGRYQVDTGHAQRISQTAALLLQQSKHWIPADANHKRLLHWACLLHEIGLAIAHAGYHKHGAYIVRHADLHGFSQSEQAILAALVRLHRGKYNRKALRDLPPTQHTSVERLALVLRLAVLLHRGRDPHNQPPARLSAEAHRLTLDFDDGWLDAHPLTRADLEREQADLEAADYALTF